MKKLGDPKMQRAYETSLREHKRATSLVYKLIGGRLNDPPKRKPKKDGRP